MSVSPALARELAAGRERFNARIAAARRARSGFDVAALADAIRVRADPVVAAVEAVAPQRSAAVAEAAIDSLVTLTSHGISGERRTLVDRVWQTVAPAYARIIGERPFEALAMLTNGALTVSATPGARVEEWLSRMAAVAPLVNAETLAATGQLVAWRAGMAHYRLAAFTIGDTLPEPLALAAIGASGSWAEVRAKLAAHPWWTPDGSGAAGVSFGGFTGFGGPFSEPPQLRGGAHGLFVRSGERIGLLVADAWGATLHPASDDEFAAGEASAAHFDAGRLMLGDRSVASALPSDGMTIAISGETVAVASPYSHFVQLLPWCLP